MLFIVFSVYRTLCKFKVDETVENKVMLAIPLSLTFGVLTGYVSDVLFLGGIKGFARPLDYGLNFYGWLFGNMIFLVVYAKSTGLSISFLVNCFLPLFAAAQAIIRIGCFCGGCCFGRPTTSFFGVVFPQGSLPYSVYGATPLMPVQLFESAYLMVVFIILIRFVDFKYRAAVYLMLMPVGRFFLEFLRGDNRGRMFFQSVLSPAQCLSFLLFAIGGFMYLYPKYRARRQPPQNSPSAP